MSTRRDFLRALMASGLLAGLAPRRLFAASGPRTIRLALALTPGSPVAQGAALAFAEARRTAGLLGAQVEMGDPGSNVFAGIGELAPARAPRGLFFTVTPPGLAPAPVLPRVYHVASGPRLRQRALSRRKEKGLRVLDWHPTLERFGAAELNQRYTRRFGARMDEAAWHGWVAVKIAAELALRSPAANPAPNVESMSFDGHKGLPLRFDAQDHHLIQPVYLVDARGKVVEEVEPEGNE